MKKIGMPAWKTGENSFGATIPYLEFLSQFGEVVLLQPNSDYNDSLDMIVVPGGADTSPNNYAEIPNYRTGMADPFKEYFAYKMLPIYIEKGIPILGICLGAQQLNVIFGGKLHQHHDFEYSKERNEQIEKLKFNSTNVGLVTKYFKKVNVNNFKVNSLHHQAVVKLGEGLLCIATSEKYGNIEIFCTPNTNILGVQYHPEEINCTFVSNWINEKLENK